MRKPINIKTLAYGRTIFAFFVCVFVSELDVKAWIPTGDTRGEATVDRVVSNATYQAVLNIVFPVEDSDQDTVYSFALRFKPYKEPESQITIRRQLNEISVTE